MFALRPLTLFDGKTLGGIHRMCFDDPWSCEAFDQLLAQPTTCGWLAESQIDREVGFILARSLDTEGEILTFAVNPAFQRQGIGRLLLSHLIEFFASTGCGQIFLEVAIDNTAAIHLYRASGFMDIGIRPNYYERPDQSLVSAKAMTYRLR
jgi:ribosomal-protein-alanine N-acetyltransferase